MVAGATDTIATSMLPYPSQRHVSRGKDSLHRTQGESRTGFSQALKRHSSAFQYRTSSFCFIPIFLHWNPPNFLQKINKISTGPEKPLITLLYRFKESLLFWRENLAPHHKGTCRFNRPWFPSLNGISASTNLFTKNLLFWWSPHFSTFEPSN